MCTEEQRNLAPVSTSPRMSLFRRMARAVVPIRYRTWLRFRQLQLRYLIDRGDRHECNICGRKVRQFAVFYGRPNSMCPRCFSLERHRLLYEYFRSKTTLLSEPNRLLHFAPENCLHRVLIKNKALEYETADMMCQFIPGIEIRPKHIMSVTQIEFPDESFDAVICSHVLEHVPDDAKAMREIYRVLKKSGFAILQVPINPTYSQTLQDYSLSSAERYRQYGSEDHLRYYGRDDYVARLNFAGFEVEVDDFVKTLDFDRFAMDASELIFRCRKPS